MRVHINCRCWPWMDSGKPQANRRGGSYRNTSLRSGSRSNRNPTNSSWRSAITWRQATSCFWRPSIPTCRAQMTCGISVFSCPSTGRFIGVKVWIRLTTPRFVLSSRLIVDVMGPFKNTNSYRSSFDCSATSTTPTWLWKLVLDRCSGDERTTTEESTFASATWTGRRRRGRTRNIDTVQIQTI